MLWFKFKRFLFWFGVVPAGESQCEVLEISFRDLENPMVKTSPGFRCSLLLRRVSGGYSGNFLCIGQQRGI